MAKKKAKGDEEEDGKKGGKGKLIVPVVLLVVRLFAGKMFFGPKPSPAALAAAAAAKETALDNLCDVQNGVAVTPSTTTTSAKAGTTPTTLATTTTTADPNAARGEVLEMDPITINLADGEHYLKVGLALQLKMGLVATTEKDTGLGAKALDMAIAAISAKTMAQLSQEPVRAALKQKLGIDTCHAYDGEVLTVFFTDFVMQ